MPKLKKIGEIHDTLTGFDFRVDPPLTPRKAIRMKCLECCCGSSHAVKSCGIQDCSLWPFRLGRGVNTDPNGDSSKTRTRATGFRLRNDSVGDPVESTSTTV